jgi:hypothetical protein
MDQKPSAASKETHAFQNRVESQLITEMAQVPFNGAFVEMRQELKMH